MSIPDESIFDCRGMMKNREIYLKALDIDVWLPRQTTFTDFVPLTPWDDLKKRIENCTKCPLHTTRTQTVFGVGNPEAAILFIGEAPGANEDNQGEPFVGQAGQLLNAMLASINLKRDDIFITNILKCRPPNNRDPAPDEVSCCTPYLVEQIDLISPKLIVALGRIAAHFLLNTQTPLSRLRNQMHQYHNIPLIATFHPAYLLRTPSEKAHAWKDMQRIAQFL